MTLIEGTSYIIYHKTFTSAINEVIKQLSQQKLYLSKEDVSTQITFGRGKPKHGMTDRYVMLCYNLAGQPAKKAVNFQIADLETRYELNMYVTSARSNDYIEGFVDIWDND